MRRKGSMPSLWDGLDDQATEALERTKELGSLSEGEATTAHLLSGVLESDDQLARLAGVDHGALARLRGHLGVDESQRPSGVSLGWEINQAIGSGKAWARSSGTAAGPAHLLVALCDQACASFVEAVVLLGRRPDQLRKAALSGLGLSEDTEPVRLTTPPPRGTADRDPLPVGDLDPEAWDRLQLRLERLPLHRIRREVHWSAISINEQDAVRRMADRRQMDEDQRYSLHHHHLAEVRRRAAQVAPEVVALPIWSGPPRAIFVVRQADEPSPWEPTGIWGYLPLGWHAWFQNRRVGLVAAWFALRYQR